MSFPYGSLNPTLNFLRQNNYMIVVASDGSGAYTTIEDAVDAGHKRIFVKPGTYTPASSISLEGVHLLGNSPLNTFIELSDGVQLSFKSHSADDYAATGSATLTNGSSTITGVGTAWNTSLASYDDPFISITGEEENGFAPVASVANDTSAELQDDMPGQTTQNDCVDFDVLNFGSIISGFRIKDTASGGAARSLLVVSGINNLICDNYFYATNSYSSEIISVGPSSSIAISTHIARNVFFGGQTSIYLLNARNTNIISNRISHSDYGIEAPDTSHDTVFISTKISHNHFEGCSTGIYLNGSSNFLSISNNSLILCSYGIDVRDSKYFSITDNHSHADTETSTALNVKDSQGFSIVGNQINREWNGIDSNDAACICLDNCQNASVTSNYCFGGYTFQATNTCTQITVTGNSFYSFNLTKTTDLELQDSVFSSNTVRFVWFDFSHCKRLSFSNNALAYVKLDFTNDNETISLVANACTKTAFFFTSTHQVTINGNSFNSSHWEWVLKFNNMCFKANITGNSFVDLEDYAIYSEGRYFVISSNLFYGTTKSIVAGPVSLISNNLISESWADADIHAISADDWDISIIGNRVSGWDSGSGAPYDVSPDSMDRFEFAHNNTNDLGS